MKHSLNKNSKTWVRLIEYDVDNGDGEFDEQYAMLNIFLMKIQWFNRLTDEPMSIHNIRRIKANEWTPEKINSGKHSYCDELSTILEKYYSDYIDSILLMES